MANGATREAVMSAALRIVSEGGLEAMTISRLAEVSGASNGSIYHHFGSRGGVVGALYRESFAELVGAMLPALDDRPAWTVVPDLAGRFLDWVVAEPTRAEFVYRASVAGLIEENGKAEFKARVMAPLGSGSRRVRRAASCARSRSGRWTRWSWPRSTSAPGAIWPTPRGST
nr:hypothetical protein GCM10020093_003110 [Planobispora longispora]